MEMWEQEVGSAVPVIAETQSQRDIDGEVALCFNLTLCINPHLI